MSASVALCTIFFGSVLVYLVSQNTAIIMIALCGQPEVQTQCHGISAVWADMSIL